MINASGDIAEGSWFHDSHAGLDLALLKWSEGNRCGLRSTRELLTASRTGLHQVAVQPEPFDSGVRPTLWAEEEAGRMLHSADPRQIPSKSKAARHSKRARNA